MSKSRREVRGEGMERGTARGGELLEIFCRGHVFQSMGGSLDMGRRME